MMNEQIKSFVEILADTVELYAATLPDSAESDVMQIQATAQRIRETLSISIWFREVSDARRKQIRLNLKHTWRTRWMILQPVCRTQQRPDVMQIQATARRIRVIAAVIAA